MSDPNYYGRLAGDSYGGFDDERAPLVLLHGLAFDRRQWGPAVNELRLIDDHRRVLVVDLPGHGDSPRFAPYASDEVVDAIHQTMVAAGMGEPVVVGHSLGRQFPVVDGRWFSETGRRRCRAWWTPSGGCIR